MLSIIRRVTLLINFKVANVGFTWYPNILHAEIE